MRAMLFFIALIISHTAFAVPVQWTLQDVYLEGIGSQISGSFVFDADVPVPSQSDCLAAWPDSEICMSGGYLDFNIDVENFYIGNSGPEWSPATGAYIDNTEYGPGPAGYYDFQRVMTVWSGGDAGNLGTHIRLIFAEPGLGNAGGVLEVSGCYYSQRYLGCAYDIAPGGTIVGTVVPIPAAVWLFASGLLALGWRSKKD